MENKKLKGIKVYNMELDEDIHIYQAYASCVNWMLGERALSSVELEVLAYFLYYNNKYKAIDDLDIRNELLFSNPTRKKIMEQFNINATKLKDCLIKIKRKGVIIDNRIMDMFIVYPDQTNSLLFSFGMRKNIPQPKYEEVEEFKFEPIGLTNNLTNEDFVTLDDLYDDIEDGQ